jgi:hypothetical protein
MLQSVNISEHLKTTAQFLEAVLVVFWNVTLRNVDNHL